MKTTSAILIALIIVIVLLALNLAACCPPERQAASPPETASASLAPAPVPFPVTDNPIMKYGYPGTAMLRYRDGYVLSYDARNRVPFWVCERLDADTLQGPANRKDARFRVDTSIPKEFRAGNGDYEGSGFDRGHMAPAGDNKESQEAMDGTFFLSNIAPQTGAGFNRGYWESLESRVRDWARSSELYVYTGPLYLPEESGDGRSYIRYQVVGDAPVAVPTHFFKLILAESGTGVEALALVLPNRRIPDEKPFSSFIVSVDYLERVSGLDFMDVLDDRTEDRLEKDVPRDVWPAAPTRRN